jgi:signal peptidase I
VLAPLPLIVLFAVVLALAGNGHHKHFRVPSEAMEPTIHVGDRVNVDLDAYEHHDPKVGDIVIVHPPVGADTNECGAPKPPDAPCAKPTPSLSRTFFIKRIVGAPGDRIAMRDGRVVRDGRLMREPYIKPCRPGDECDLPRAIRVPRGEYFLLGDNRGASDDSRFWGPVPRRALVGRVET